MQKISLVHCFSTTKIVFKKQSQNVQQAITHIHQLESLHNTDVVAHTFHYESGLENVLAKQLKASAVIILLVDEDNNAMNTNLFTLIAEIRKMHLAGIFILSLPEQAIPSTLIYKAGVDQFMASPFDFLEVDARVYSLLQRYQRSKDQPHHFSQIAFTPAQSIVLSYLIKHQGQVISKQALQQLVLNKNYQVYDRNLDMHVSNIRKKLADAGYSKLLIKTVRNLGYIYQDIELSLDATVVKVPEMQRMN